MLPFFSFWLYQLQLFTPIGTCTTTDITNLEIATVQLKQKSIPSR